MGSHGKKWLECDTWYMCSNLPQSLPGPLHCLCHLRGLCKLWVQPMWLALSVASYSVEADDLSYTGCPQGQTGSAVTFEMHNLKKSLKETEFCSSFIHLLRLNLRTQVERVLLLVMWLWPLASQTTRWAHTSRRGVCVGPMLMRNVLRGVPFYLGFTSGSH